VSVDLLSGLVGGAPEKVEKVYNRLDNIEINLQQMSVDISVITVTNTNF